MGVESRTLLGAVLMFGSRSKAPRYSLGSVGGLPLLLNEQRRTGKTQRYGLGSELGFQFISRSVWLPPSSSDQYFSCSNT